MITMLLALGLVGCSQTTGGPKVDPGVDEKGGPGVGAPIGSAASSGGLDLDAWKPSKTDGWQRPDQYDEGSIGVQTRQLPPPEAGGDPVQQHGIVLSFLPSPRANNMAHIVRTFWLPATGGASNMLGGASYGPNFKTGMITALQSGTIDVDVACEIGPLTRNASEIPALNFRAYSGAALANLQVGGTNRGCRLSKTQADGTTWQEWAFTQGVRPSVGDELQIVEINAAAAIADYKACVTSLGDGVALYSATVITKPGNVEANFQHCSWLQVDGTDFGGGGGPTPTPHPIPAASP